MDHHRRFASASLRSVGVSRRLPSSVRRIPSCSARRLVPRAV